MYFIVCGACNMYSCILCIHGCMLQHAHILWWRLMAKPMLFYNIFIMFLLNNKNSLIRRLQQGTPKSIILFLWTLGVVFELSF